MQGIIYLLLISFCIGIDLAGDATGSVLAAQFCLLVLSLSFSVRLEEIDSLTYPICPNQFPRPSYPLEPSPSAVYFILVVLRNYNIG